MYFWVCFLREIDIPVGVDCKWGTWGLGDTTPTPRYPSGPARTLLSGSGPLGPKMTRRGPHRLCGRGGGTFPGRKSWVGPRFVRGLRRSGGRDKELGWGGDAVDVERVCVSTVSQDTGRGSDPKGTPVTKIGQTQTSGPRLETGPYSDCNHYQTSGECLGTGR